MSEQQTAGKPKIFPNLVSILEDAKFISDEDYDRREEQKNQQREAKRISAQLEKVPARYRESRFETFLCTDDRQRSIVAKVQSSDESFLLYGGNGSGKTRLAFAKYRQLIEQGRGVKYILAMDLFDEVKQSFSDQSTRKLIERYTRFDYLIIDEIDKRYGSQNEYLQLYRLINARYNELKHTMLITNADRTQLVEVIGQSVIDRLIEDGIFIEMNWESFRKAQRKARHGLERENNGKQKESEDERY